MQSSLEIDDWPSKVAFLSEDQRYRYYLSRQWGDDGRTVGFICLNPSTADDTLDDPTVRRCIGYARAWGGTKMVIGNLFAFRSTDPRKLKSESDPVGSENDEWLKKIVDECDIVVAAWGEHGVLGNRDLEVKERFRGKLYALKLTKNSCPSHPLYLPKDLAPFVFSGI